MEGRILKAFVIAPIVLLVFTQIASAQTLDITESYNWPCDDCHPHEEVGKKIAHKKEAELVAHDKLAEDRREACRVCHLGDENPAILKLADGTQLSIETEVPRLCYQCHQRKYKDWKDGIHGKPPKCTTIGCHSPHAPRIDVERAKEAVEATFPEALTPAIQKKELPIENIELPLPPVKYLHYKDYPYPASVTFTALNMMVIGGTLAVIALLVVPTLLRRRKR
jgi:hypothetical protein